VRPSSDVLGVSALIFWLEKNYDAKLLRAWQKTNGVTSPGKGNRFDGTAFVPVGNEELINSRKSKS
jgi:hypothetical protein